MDEASILLEEIDCTIGGKPILQGVTLGFARDRINIVLGPNGAGKSTLLKIAAGRIAPSRGRVTYEGEAIARIGAEALARRRAFLSQHIEMGFAMTAEAVVMMGRYPYFRRTPGHRDHRIVEAALELVGMAAMRTRILPTLSGGERQRVHLARVLAQIWEDEDAPAPRTLFLDEPLGALDIRHQLQIMEIVRGLTARRCTIVMTLHDLNIALEHGDRMIFLHDGRLVDAIDRPDPIDPALIRRVFDVRSALLTGDDGNRALRFYL